MDSVTEEESRSPEERWMLRCLELARRGAGSVSPNPMVGAVIIRDGRIIGEGFHERFGGPHAEVNAIRNAQEDVRGATIAVNLEPCNFTGKTPPCTELLIQSGIARVIVGMTDPNPRVSGGGVEQLRAAGIEVITGVLEEECRSLNRAFISFIRRGVPYVTLKVAQTLDGKIARTSGKATWITGRESRIRAHQMRAETDAILVGANTVVVDDPALTVREVEGRNPARIILSCQLLLSPSATVFNNAQRERVLLFTGAQVPQDRRSVLRELERKNVLIHQLPLRPDGALPLADILRILGKAGIASLLVEGGAATYAGFLNHHLADAMAIFVAPKIFGRGVDAFGDLDLNGPQYQKLKHATHTRLGEDMLILGVL